MANDADLITCEWDEGGLFLDVAADDDDHRFRVLDPEALLAAVKDAVDPWVAEREAARASMPARDDGDGYAPDDPKHPSFHDRMSGLYDNRAGK